MLGLRRVAWVLALATVSACSGSDGNGGDEPGQNGGPLSCAGDEFALAGTVGAEPVSYRGTLRGHAWIQGTDPNTFEAPFDGGGSVHLEWMDVVADGETTVVTGSVALPPGGALGGQTFTSGSGSMTKRDNGVLYELTALAQSVQCVTEPCPPDQVEGTLRGCAEWTPVVF